MPEPLVTYELDRDVALLGLNRDDVRNAINGALLNSLKECMLRATEEARAAVIFSHREKHFSAGLDLAKAQARRAETPSAHPRKTRSKWHTTFDLISRGEIPFVSALKGATVGGGLELAAATARPRRRRDDVLRVAREPARHLRRRRRRLGEHPATAGLRTDGRPHAHGARALRRRGRTQNLCQYVVPAGESFAKAKELAHKIATNAPLTN